MTTQPTIETERLVLRPYDRADAADIRRLAGERAIAATTIRIPHPYPEGAAEAWIAGHPASFAAGERVGFAITRRDDGGFAGGIGLELAAEHACAELGYWVAVPYWGRGYATEAARAVVDYGFRVHDLHRIEAHHFATNPASGRVLEKIGMQREGTLRERILKWGRWEDLHYYAILREDWVEGNAGRTNE